MSSPYRISSGVVESHKKLSAVFQAQEKPSHTSNWPHVVLKEIGGYKPYLGQEEAQHLIEDYVEGSWWIIRGPRKGCYRLMVKERIDGFTEADFECPDFTEEEVESLINGSSSFTKTERDHPWNKKLKIVWSAVGSHRLEVYGKRGHPKAFENPPGYSSLNQFLDKVALHMSSVRRLGEMIQSLVCVPSTFRVHWLDSFRGPERYAEPSFDFSRLKNLSPEGARLEVRNALAMMGTQPEMRQVIFDPSERETIKAVLSFEPFPANMVFKLNSSSPTDLRKWDWFWDLEGLNSSACFFFFQFLVRSCVFCAPPSVPKDLSRLSLWKNLSAGDLRDADVIVVHHESQTNYYAHLQVLREEASGFQMVLEGASKKVEIFESKELCELLLQALYHQVVVTDANFADCVYLAECYGLLTLGTEVIHHWIDMSKVSKGWNFPLENSQDQLELLKALYKLMLRLEVPLIRL